MFVSAYITTTYTNCSFILFSETLRKDIKK